MATTPQFFWPYQALTDPPNGAALGQDLALAIEATLSPISTSVTGHESRLAAIEAQWSTWVPTLSNMTVGSGVLTARFKQIGKDVDFHWKFVMAADSTIGTNPSFTLPVAPHASYANFRTIMSTSVGLVDNGTNSYPGVLHLTGASTVRIRYINFAALGAFADVTATAPFTWTPANADEIDITGRYEAA